MLGQALLLALLQIKTTLCTVIIISTCCRFLRKQTQARMERLVAWATTRIHTFHIRAQLHPRLQRMRSCIRGSQLMRGFSMPVEKEVAVTGVLV